MKLHAERVGDDGYAVLLTTSERDMIKVIDALELGAVALREQRADGRTAVVLELLRAELCQQTGLVEVGEPAA